MCRTCETNDHNKLKLVKLPDLTTTSSAYSSNKYYLYECPHCHRNLKVWTPK